MENINLTKLDKHSKIYEDSCKILELTQLTINRLISINLILWNFKGSLGSFEWSPDSSKIAYIAEQKKTSKEKCFFTSKIDNTENEEAEFLNEANYEQVICDQEFKKYLKFDK